MRSYFGFYTLYNSIGDVSPRRTEGPCLGGGLSLTLALIVLIV